MLSVPQSLKEGGKTGEKLEDAVNQQLSLQALLPPLFTFYPA